MAEITKTVQGLLDATMKHHRNAERQSFVKVLMSGKIDPKLYATFLYNQIQCYSKLEYYARANGLFKWLPGIERAEWVDKDFKELWKEEVKPKTCPSTIKYVEHIEKIKDDPEKLMAHIYCRHMAELSGGQMIRRKIPGGGMMYKFRNPSECKRVIREQVNNYYNAYKMNIVNETLLCFEYATQLFRELMEE